MNPPRRKKVNSKKTYEWMIFGDAYFALALLGCKELLKHVVYINKEGKILFNEAFEELKFRSSHPNEILIFPIVFNLKHAIELSLKDLDIIFFSKYYYNHDLKFLFDKFLSNSKNSNTNLYKVVEKLYIDTWDTISKYYYGIYLPNKKRKTNPDVDNEGERYPQHLRKRDRVDRKLKNPCYQIWDLGDYVDAKLIQDIKSDIEFLEKKFAQAKRDVDEIKNS